MHKSLMLATTPYFAQPFAAERALPLPIGDNNSTGLQDVYVPARGGIMLTMDKLTRISRSPGVLVIAVSFGLSFTISVFRNIKRRMSFPHFDRSSVLGMVLGHALLLTSFPVAMASESSDVCNDLAAGGTESSKLCPAEWKDLLVRVNKIKDEFSETPPDIDEVALVPPPRSPLPEDEPVAWRLLEQAIDRIRNGLNFPPGPPSSTPVGPQVAFLLQGQRDAEHALVDLIKADTDFPSAMNQLQSAISVLSRVLGQSPRNAELDTLALEASAGLTGVVEQMTRDSIERAILAGVDSQIIDEAEAALLRGTELAKLGQFVEATAIFEVGFNFTTDATVFDITLFEQNIRNALTGQTVGYTYAINRNGLLYRTGVDGFSRTIGDPPVTPSLPGKEMNIASVSKIVTTLGVLTLLQDLGVSINEPIFNYLPSNWIRGPNLLSITFRDLLTHKSGLDWNRNGPYGFDDLRSYIDLGTFPEFKVYQYQNANFALLRIIIPYLKYSSEFIEDVLIGEGFFDGTLNELLAALYIDHIQNRVFAPTGGAIWVNRRCSPNDPSPTRYYPPPAEYDVVSPGFQHGDWSLICGGGGWYMTVRELAALLANQRNNDALLSPPMRELMNQNYLGWNDPNEWSWADGAYGIYRSHGGDIRNLNACVMSYPNGVDVSLLINSDDASWGGYQCQMLADAYDNAWIAP